MKRFLTSLATLAAVAVTSQNFQSYSFGQTPEAVLKDRSASEDISFGRIISVDDHRLNIRDGEVSRSLNLVPETVVEIDGRPVRLSDLPPNARVRVLYDVTRPNTATRIILMRDEPAVRPPAPGITGQPLAPPAGEVPLPPAPQSGIDPSAPAVIAKNDPVTAVPLGGTFQTTAEGVLVRLLDQDGSAARAGLQIGDLIKRVGDQNVATVDGFYRALHRSEPRALVPVTFLRDGQELTADVALPANFRPLFTGTKPLSRTEVPQVPVMTSAQLGWTLGERGEATLIVAVQPDSSAALSGLRVGDEILTIQGEKVLSPAHALQLIQAYGDSASVTVEVRRNAEKVTRGLLLPSATTIAAHKLPTADQVPMSPDGRVDELIRNQLEMQRTLDELRNEIRMLRGEVSALRQGR
ncbi:PDZ domain-containing protein [Planctomicrobium sp. SH664]|uniref:PDZ domain-containing protein n=1 Tax=Planctomicrobium sp. SH664 TaxID=3448125 RepID=UPI003F5BCEFC